MGVMTLGFRDKFEANYAAVWEPSGNRNGFKIRYRYYGPWYVWDLSPTEYRRCKLSFAVAGILRAAVYLFVSTLYADVNMAAYFYAPAALSLIALLFELLGVVQFCIQKEKVTELDMDGIAWKLKIAAPVDAGFLVASILTGLWHLLAVSFTALSVMVILGYGVCAALSFYVFLKYKALPFHTEKNPLRDQLMAEQEADESEE